MKKKTKLISNHTRVTFTFILLIIFNLSLFINNCFSQWVQQYPVTPYVHLLDVYFANENTGWACGTNGIILKTTNAGGNWIIQQTTASGKSLYGIHAVDSNIVYCVGRFETILKTTNGGENWQTIINGPIGQGNSLRAVFFTDENTGWICGFEMKILKTTNGCVSFDTIYIPATVSSDIYFKNNLEGLVCGEGANMYKSTNGGYNWTQIFLPVGTQAADFFRLSFINDYTGYTQGVQNNKVFKTTNFGDSWDSISVVYEADESYCIYFPSEDTGWCAGTYGLMFKTTNGGYDWYQEDLSQFNSAFIRSLWFHNNYTGWAVGGATKILYTETGGTMEVILNNSNIPEKFTLYQNYPNPFNNQTKIKFDIENDNVYVLEVYDYLGRKVDELINKFLKVGCYSIEYNADKLSSGVYFYKIEAGTFNDIKRMLLIK